MGFSIAPARADLLDFSAPLSGWTTDRAAPAAFLARDHELQITLGTGNAGYQGKKYAIFEPATTASWDFYVSPTWAGQLVNSGVWLLGGDSEGGLSAYAIIAYRQSAAIASGFYSFNYYTGDWSYLAAAAPGWNALQENVTSGGIQYVVNGAASDFIVDDTYTASFSGLIINSWNSGISQTFQYDNLITASPRISVRALPAPEIGTFGLLLTGLVLLGRRSPLKSHRK